MVVGFDKVIQSQLKLRKCQENGTLQSSFSTGEAACTPSNLPQSRRTQGGRSPAGQCDPARKMTLLWSCSATEKHLGRLGRSTHHLFYPEHGGGGSRHSITAPCSFKSITAGPVVCTPPTSCVPSADFLCPPPLHL